MDERVGQILASLSEDDGSETDMIDIERINSAVSPEYPVKPGDVYVRSMLIVSDRVNSFGGRFPDEEHERLVGLLVDSPVLIGHKKDSLPIGRTFHAERIERQGVRWVRSYFYWLKDTAGAEDLRRQIDQGIVKECSIGFVFGRAECSICGRDIRECEHQPLVDYEVGGTQRQCWFDYRDIRAVLETSLVYRGATPDTRVGAELAVPPVAGLEGRSVNIPAVLEPPYVSQIDPLARCVVMPRYAGVAAQLHIHGSDVSLRDTDGRRLAVMDFGLSCKLTDHGDGEGDSRSGRRLSGVLVGYRGKSRCTSDQVRRYLAGLSGPVARLKFLLWPGQPEAREFPQPGASRMPIGVMPHEEVRICDLNPAVARLGSRDGAWICALDASAQVWYTTGTDELTAGGAVVWVRSSEDQTLLILSEKQQTRTWRLAEVVPKSALAGRGCLAEPIDRPQNADSDSGEYRGASVTVEAQHADTWRLRSDDRLFDGCHVRPVVLNGQHRLIVRFCANGVRNQETQDE